MKLKRKRLPNLQEVNTYVDDLERITILRDDAKRNQNTTEWARYNTCIEVMQLVLLELNKVK